MLNFSGSVKKQKIGKPVDVYYWSGLVDVAKRRGFDPDYDTWHPANQRNYERGRLQAMNMQAAGLVVPTGTVYSKVLEERMNAAVAAVGAPYTNNGQRTVTQTSPPSRPSGSSVPSP